LLKANEVINACLPHANKSVRIGITGVPGVGKAPSLKRLETFNWIREKVAVLAVDPSSDFTRKYFG
jgi:LAO/AO transport system kinase